MRPALIRATATLVLGLVATSCTTEPSPGISISLGGQALTLVQGAHNAMTVDVARVDYQGDVMLAAFGLPTGVSASFAPASLSGSASTSTMTLTATGIATPGDASVTITATGDGGESSTATLALTVNVAGSFTITASPAATYITRGATAATTVSVTRSGGFAQDVTLSATGLPSGVTASFNSTVVTFTATTSAALGTATVTIAGATTGLANQTTNVGLTVQEVGSTTPLSLDFCSDFTPTWFAFQNEGAAWTRVIPDGSGTVTANVTAKFAVALVFVLGHTYTQVFYTTLAELAPLHGVPCPEEPSRKTLNGTVANMGSNTVRVRMSSGSAIVSPPNTTFQLLNIPNAAGDLVASRFSPPFQFSPNWMPDKVIVRRGLDIANNGMIPVLDWSAGEAATATVSTLTLTGSGTDTVFGLNNFRTNRSAGNRNAGMSTFHTVWYSDMVGGSVSFTSVPSASTVTGDMHTLIATARSTGGSGYSRDRGARTYFRTATDKTIALGAHISAPTVTTAATTPYLRHRVQLAAGEYTGEFGVSLGQLSKSASMSVSQGYLGAAPTTWDVTMPDLSGVSGWDNAWGLSSGAATNHSVTLHSLGNHIYNIMPAEGTTVKYAAYYSSSTMAQLSRTDARSQHFERSASLIGGRAFRKEQ